MGGAGDFSSDTGCHIIESNWARSCGGSPASSSPFTSGVVNAGGVGGMMELPSSHVSTMMSLASNSSVRGNNMMNNATSTTSPENSYIDSSGTTSSENDTEMSLDDGSVPENRVKSELLSTGNGLSMLNPSQGVVENSKLSSYQNVSVKGMDYHQSNQSNQKWLKNSKKSRSKSGSGDMLLPITNICRIMKKSLPSNAKVTRESKEMVQDSVTKFIQFLTSRASNRCSSEKRKIINGDDIIWAMKELGFNGYVELYSKFLRRWRETSSTSKAPGSYEWNGAQTVPQSNPAENLASGSNTVMSNSPSLTVSSSEQACGIPPFGGFNFSQQLLPQSYSLAAASRGALSPSSTNSYGRYPSSSSGGGGSYGSMYMPCPTSSQAQIPSSTRRLAFSPSISGYQQQPASISSLNGVAEGVSTMSSCTPEQLPFSPGSNMSPYFLPAPQHASHSSIDNSAPAYLSMDYVLDERNRMRFPVKRGSHTHGTHGLLVNGSQQQLQANSGSSRMHLEAYSNNTPGAPIGRMPQMNDSVHNATGALTSQSANMLHNNMRISSGSKPLMCNKGEVMSGVPPGTMLPQMISFEDGSPTFNFVGNSRVGGVVRPRLDDGGGTL